MNEYFCTTSFSNPTGAGYFTVYAKDENEARQKMQDRTKGKWCILYRSLDEIHPSDRKCHGIIT